MVAELSTGATAAPGSEYISGQPQGTVSSEIGPKLAVWEFSLKTRVLRLSEQWSAMLGLAPMAMVTTAAELRHLVHPDDRAFLRKLYREMLALTVSHCQHEFRVRSANDTWLWIIATCWLVADEKTGELSLIAGTVTDRGHARFVATATTDAEMAPMQQLLALSSDWYWEQDAEFRFTKVVGAQTDARAKLLSALTIGKARWETPGLVPLQADWQEHRADLLAHRPYRDLVLQFKVDGETLFSRVSGDPVFDGSGKFSGYRGIGRDVTREVRTENARREGEQRFHDVAAAAGEYVWEIDREGRYTFVSPRVIDVLGYAPAELIGRKPSEFMPAVEAQRVLKWAANRSHEDGAFRDFEHQSLTKSGDAIWQVVSGVPFFDEAGALAGYRGTGMDVTQRKLVEARYRRLATQDALTGLANRTSLQERLTQEIELSVRSDRAFAMLFIDLDRFKVINDTLGHAVGDALLQEVAKRLHACIRAGDMVARIGGDEFVIGLFAIAHPEHAGHVARKVLHALSQPCMIHGHTLNTAGSVGIAIYPDDGANMDTLLKHGDVAMYHAKQLGRNRYEFYTPEMNLGALERLQLENELRVALKAGQFVLHYQPRVDVAGNVQCVEALIRWQHPTRGLLAADKFVQVAEDMGLIADIGRWVLARACEELAACPAIWNTDIKLAVNLSPTELRGRQDFAVSVSNALAATHFDANRLEFEITETSLLHPTKGDLACLNECRNLGVEFAIDDFGTGYSSLGYLQQLPVQTLKIDRSFVANPAHRPIVEAILSITQKFKLRSVAEGIETREQFADMCKLGCTQLQGYYICAPVPMRSLPRALADLTERAHLA
jgi:diguanylate cyclase (GGDEF)-like protein/PAS domain S-box-containing protein